MRVKHKQYFQLQFSLFNVWITTKIYVLHLSLQENPDPKRLLPVANHRLKTIQMHETCKRKNNKLTLQESPQSLAWSQIEENSRRTWWWWNCSKSLTITSISYFGQWGKKVRTTRKKINIITTTINNNKVLWYEINVKHWLCAAVA